MPKSKLEARIDCVTSDNRANDTSCKNKEKIQDGFMSTSEASGTRDGKGVNYCPYLHEILKCTKNSHTLENRDKFAQKTHAVSRDFFN